jgi:hypothetical protein
MVQVLPAQCRALCLAIGKGATFLPQPHVPVHPPTPLPLPLPLLPPPLRRVHIVGSSVNIPDMSANLQAKVTGES